LLVRRLAVALSVAVLALGATLAGSVAPAEAASPGWIVTCTYTRSLTQDPIVAPGPTGRSHSHDFVGNRTTGSTSSYATMRRGASSCGTKADNASYWMPSLFRGNSQVKPAGSYAGRSTRQRSYYRADNLKPGTKIEPFPADLRVVAGNAKARNAAENPALGKEIYWGCSENSTGKLTAPPASCGTGIISLHVGFPNCWNGKLTHKNDTANLRYPSSGVCPTGFTRALPRLIQRFEYPVGPKTGSVWLASGATFTAHADFWNTWDQAALTRLVKRCLTGNVSCGKDPA
jgi:hypothetical protein